MASSSSSSSSNFRLSHLTAQIPDSMSKAHSIEVGYLNDRIIDLMKKHNTVLSEFLAYKRTREPLIQELARTNKSVADINSLSAIEINRLTVENSLLKRKIEQLENTSKRPLEENKNHSFNLNTSPNKRIRLSEESSNILKPTAYATLTSLPSHPSFPQTEATLPSSPLIGHLSPAIDLSNDPNSPAFPDFLSHPTSNDLN